MGDRDLSQNPDYLKEAWEAEDDAKRQMEDDERNEGRRVSCPDCGCPAVIQGGVIVCSCLKCGHVG